MTRSAVILATFAMSVGQAFAQDQETRSTHVRADTASVRELIDEGVRRSATIRALVDRLDSSDVVVYVRIRDLPRFQLDGRLGFLTVGGGRRYVVVELSCERPRDVQLVTLGHELRHAVEIADAPEVTSSPSLAAHYTRAGTHLGFGPGQSFETAAAVSSGRQVHHDLVTPAMRFGNGQ